MNETTVLTTQTGRALELIKQHLGPSLVSVYLHGSVVMGGLRPGSDLDLLVVIATPMDDAIRRSLTQYLMEISYYPARDENRHPLEVIVVERSCLEPLPYPARIEYVYGEWLRDAFEAGAIPEAVADPEYTIVLAQAREQSRPVMGPDLRELLPEVPADHLRSAIRDSSPSLIETLQGDERNVLLTLSRMWHILATGEFVPKDVAAEWAATRLPGEAAETMREAQVAYLAGADMCSEELKRKVEQLASTLQCQVRTILEECQPDLHSLRS